MKTAELNNLIGLSVEEAAKYCKEKGISLEFYPVEAKPTAMMKNNLVRFWHNQGIVAGWALGNPWDAEK